MVTRRARRAEHPHCSVRYASDRRVSSGSALFASGRRVFSGSACHAVFARGSARHAVFACSSGPRRRPHVAFIRGSARDTGRAMAHYVGLAIGPVCDAGIANCFVCSAGFTGGPAFFADRARGYCVWLLVTG